MNQTPDSSNTVEVPKPDPETQERCKQLENAVADELGVDTDDLSVWDVFREAAEAYTGGDALGAWRDD